MTTPTPKKPKDLAGYLDAMSQSVFSSGISWEVIEKKWPDISEAFDGFDPMKVAAFTPADVDRLMADPRVVRNRKKLEAIVRNAGELIVVERDFGSVPKYFASFDGDNEALVKDLHKKFAFLGPSVAHVFLYRVAWDVEAQSAWAHEHFGHEGPPRRHAR